MRLAGKVAIISGGASGMGGEEARLFAREGAKVVIADLLEQEGQQVAAEIVAAGGQALFALTDVTSETDWKHVVDLAVGRFGGLDILVNNAGLSSTSAADPLDTEGWRRIMDVNATGVFLGSKYAVLAMQASGGGAIVSGDSANDLMGVALDPNVLIQESKVASCDIQPGRRPTGPALLRYVEDYRRRAGITVQTGNVQLTRSEDVS